MSLRPKTDLYLRQIEAELEDTVQAALSRPQAVEATRPGTGPAAYYDMMRYHLGWADESGRPLDARGGKRLRPLLCLLACEAAGGDPRQALPAACAVELVHNFSLIHDDIQDGSRLRRGRRAVWDVWGVPQAINAGDGMFVVARLALHRLAGRGVPLLRTRAAAEALDRACLALCEGQFLDMSFEGRPDVALDEYLWMIGRKTAALLATSAQLGAILATDDARLIACFTRFGESLGLAFQVEDDVLGVWGSEEVTGKSAATDLRDKKKTLPVVYALGHPGDRAAAGELAALYATPGPLDAPAIQACLGLLDRLGARQYAEEMCDRYHRLALDALDDAGCRGPADLLLRDLVGSLRVRQT